MRGPLCKLPWHCAQLQSSLHCTCLSCRHIGSLLSFLELENCLWSTGNAWTDADEDNKGAVEFWHSHALISDTTRDGLMQKCNFSRIGPLQVEAVSSDTKVSIGFLPSQTPQACSGVS